MEKVDSRMSLAEKSVVNIGKFNDREFCFEREETLPINGNPAILVDNDGMATGSIFLLSGHLLPTIAINRLIARTLLRLDSIINHRRTLVDHIDVLHVHDPFDAVGAHINILQS